MKHIFIVIVGKQQFGRLQHGPLIILGILNWNLGLREVLSCVHGHFSRDGALSKLPSQEASCVDCWRRPSSSLLRVFCLHELKDLCSKASHHQSMIRITVISCGYKDPAQVCKQTGYSALESKVWAASKCIITAFSAVVQLNNQGLLDFFNKHSTEFFTVGGSCWWRKKTCVGG